jgi:hypothetical protein
MNTNVDYYLSAFNEDGVRIGSKICNFNPNKSKNNKKKVALIEEGKTLWPDAAVVEIISAEDFVKYLNGYRRDSNGAPAEYTPPEPTAEEKAEAEKAKLKNEYESGKADLIASLQAAQLAGNTDAVTSIQAEYKEFSDAYKQAIEEVG